MPCWCGGVRGLSCSPASPADVTRGGWLLLFTSIPRHGVALGGRQHLGTARTWQHVVKAGAGFRVAQQ